MNQATTHIKKWNYGEYASSNYGAHTTAIKIGTLVLFFSYQTVIAFEELGHVRRVSKNYWSTTTGKHLNWLMKNKAERLDSETFDKELAEILTKHNLIV